MKKLDPPIPLEAMSPSGSFPRVSADDLADFADDFIEECPPVLLLDGFELLNINMDTPQLKDSPAVKLGNPPRQIDRLKVKNIKTIDGVKLEFNEQTWLLFRLSG